MTNEGSSIEDIWPATVEYRARSVDGNNVTSEWAEAALTVLPSSLSASLSFAPTTVVRGANATLTAVPTNGTGPYALSYQWRWGGMSNWNNAAFTTAETTYNWASNIDFRVRAVDSFSATSEWSEAAALTVLQPSVELSFSPSVVTQRQPSTATASATNVTGAVTWQWQRKSGATWVGVTNAEATITDYWATTVEYRVRSVDENNVTSDWATATLTVMPSEIAASLAFSPETVVRGEYSTLTATGTNGYGTYRYSYQYRWGGATNWRSAVFTTAETTYNWVSNIEFRVRAADDFNSTSEWSEAALLTVLQPTVTVAFNPSTVTQSQASVATASVTNALGEVRYQWQHRTDAGAWTSATNEESTISSVWGQTIDYRARSVDSNGVVSAWSEPATLTVMPSEVSVGLAFDPTNVVRGVQGVLTATPTNGTAPYAYTYQWRWSGAESWTTASFAGPVVSNAWASNVDVRVRVVDAFSATSAWSSAASLLVLQPEVSLSFSPSVVTQSQGSVLTAVATNATAPTTFQWQRLMDGIWVNIAGTDSTISNVWPTDVDFRARSIDANSVTSPWSETATLTVRPSEIAMDLSFSPTNVLRGFESVLTSTASNGYGSYTYYHQWRYAPGGEWSARSAIAPVFTNEWDGSVDYRVQAVDEFNSTSAWATASLTVVQPVLTVGFSPSVVTQSQGSVLTASASNVTGSVTWQWQKKVGSVWTSVTNEGSTISDIWPSTIDYRARSVDENNVTSDWAEATLTVMPSEIATSLSFSPATVIRGIESEMTAAPSNGMAPYALTYQWRWSGTSNWLSSGYSLATNSYAWASNVDFRVRAVDAFKSTSAWTEATLTVVQPQVTATFAPSTVTQSFPSVLSASVTNATAPLAYQWQKKVGTNWTSVVDTGAAITNVWGSTIDYRARTIDANGVTSEWSAPATLTVLPSIISASLAFNPTSYWRGSNAVLSTTVSNGTAPFRYAYEWRLTGAVEWAASPYTNAAVTNAWENSVDYRVRVVDSFNATSAWSAAATLRVVQPLVTAQFTPSTVTQRMPSVVAASVANASLPVEYQWQRLVDGVWSNLSDTASAITNTWPFDVDYRVRTIDANSVTSEWSSGAALTVLPSIISASATMSPTNVIRGSNAVVTAVATNGTAPYRYYHQWRYTTGEWQEEAEGPAVVTNKWDYDVEYRVRVADSFNSTSAWAATALTVRQPAVTAAFSPSVVTQSRSSVVSATVTNATLPVTYEWQMLSGSEWTNVAGSAAAITNVWPFDVDYRARSIDANNVTSEWSSAATLTVLPSAIAMSLAFNPTNVRQGSNAVLTAVASNGTPPYVYYHQWRYSPSGEWSSKEEIAPIITNKWDASVDYRVHVVDSFNSTSAWMTASLTVVRPAVTVAFTPSTVTQSVASVLSATVTNASGAVTWQWQRKVGSVWTDVTNSAAAITNVWPATVEYRARSIDANSVTSDWSASKTLTVMPSIVSVNLAVAPTNIIRGSNAVLTATATNGTAPYTYYYEWKLTQSVTWATASFSNAVVTNKWNASTDFRVRVVDAFSSTSGWSAVRTLVVQQPLTTLTPASNSVVQSRPNVVTASVANATAPASYQWQKNVGSGWEDMTNTAATVSNTWPSSMSFRARSIDANSVTSEWSAASILTVTPSAIGVSLSFAPTTVYRGSNATLTAAASNGFGTYTYSYEFSPTGTPVWVAATNTGSSITKKWDTTTVYRVRVVDSFNATSSWSSAATLTVVQATVSLAFQPTQVVHGVRSVLRATVTNAAGPCTYIYETRAAGTTNWDSSPFTNAATTNEWLTSVEYRACAVVDNHYTTQWSSVAALAVVAPNLRVSLALSTNEVTQGTAVVATSTPTNGTGPYVYEYQSKDITQPGQAWVDGPWTAAVVTNTWNNHVLVRVRVRDTATTNLSYWSEEKVLLVWPPAAPVLASALPIIGISVQPAATGLGMRDVQSGTTDEDMVSISWVGVEGQAYLIYYAETMGSEWQEHPARFVGGADGVTTGNIPWKSDRPKGFFRIREAAP